MFNLNTQIIEIKEYLEDSDLLLELYEVTKLLRKMETELHFTISLNKDDYCFMLTIVHKIRKNLEKVNAIIKLQE